MGSGGSETTYNPNYPLIYQKLLKGLTPTLEGELAEGTPSSASTAKKMYEGFLGNNAQLGLPTEYSDILNKIITTGLPYQGDIIQSPLYASAYGAYQTNLDQALAQAKETSGMTGSLNGSGGQYWMGKAAGDTTSQFIKDLSEQALSQYNTEANRQVTGLQSAFQEAALPYDQIQAMMSASQATELGQQPWLTYLLQTMLGKGGDISKTESSSPWASIGGSAISALPALLALL